MTEIKNAATLFAKEETIATTHVIFWSREGEMEHQSGHFSQQKTLKKPEVSQPLEWGDYCMHFIKKTPNYSNNENNILETFQDSLFCPEMLKYTICILPWFQNLSPDLLHILQMNGLHFVKD